MLIISHIWASSEFNYIIIVFTYLLILSVRLYLRILARSQLKVAWILDEIGSRKTRKGGRQASIMFDNIKYHHFFIIQERIKQRGRRKKTKAEVDTLNNFIFLHRWRRHRFSLLMPKISLMEWQWRKFLMWWGENFHVNIFFYLPSCNPDATGMEGNETKVNGRQKGKLDSMENMKLNIFSLTYQTSIFL